MQSTKILGRDAGRKDWPDGSLKRREIRPDPRRALVERAPGG
jgi:hypothetical protein